MTLALLIIAHYSDKKTAGGIGRIRPTREILEDIEIGGELHGREIEK
jgi:hypothetical protein